MLLAALIALLFLGAGAGLMLDGIDHIHDSIESQIADDGTRKEALEVVDRMKDTAKKFADTDGDGEKELLKLVQQHETTTAELKNHLDAVYQQRIEYQQQMLTMRFELKDTLSREQWNNVFAQTVPSE